MTNQKNIYTIAPEEDFLRSLATYIFSLVKADMFELSSVRVILPNRRSTLKLKEEFMNISPNKAVLLPQIFSLSEMDESQAEILSLVNPEDILPVISAEKRLLLLSDIIISNAAAFGLNEINFDAALKLSQSLATLLDDMEKHQLGIEALENILPDELSRHRQVSLDFIRYIFSEYPKLLETLGVTDHARRTNHILGLYTASLQNNGSPSSIFIAGSTGSIPATRNLIKAISSLNNGYVILPYTDLSLNSFEWAELGSADNQISHQKHLHKLLRFIEVQPADVKFLAGNRTEKQKTVSNLMRAASTLQSWRNSKGQGLEWIKLINAENLVHESKLISAVIRHKLGQGSSVALITNNRNLAEAVNLYLRKLGVEIDDSSGVTLDKTPEGRFFIEASDLISSGYRITSLLSLLKHELSEIPKSELSAIEKDTIRKNSIKNLSQLISSLQEGSAFEATRKILDKIHKASEASKSLSGLISQTYSVINALAPNLEINESWQDIESLLNSFATTNLEVPNQLFAESVTTILATKKTWPKYTPNRRVAILSPIEARLQHFDCVILGDLTLGSWPAGKFSPWFSRNMFKNMELPFEEDSISLSAHDFASQLHQKQVYITHSNYNSGEPLVESPFVSRFKAFYKAATTADIIPDETYHETVAQLDGNNSSRKTSIKPAPKIPASASIKKLSVTKIETLLKNPYAIYASEVLRLRKLDELEREPDHKEYGTFVHKVLENFTEAHSLDKEKINTQVFTESLEKAYKQFEGLGQVSGSWKMQVNSMASWFVEIERQDASNLLAIKAELPGSINFNNFTLTCKADRIELAKGNIINIADYKTGRFPKQLHVQRLISPQLLLEGLMVKHGGFNGVDSNYKLGFITYYNFSFSDKGPDKKLYADIDMQEIIPVVETELNNLIADLNNPEVPYLVRPNPKLQPEFDDYEHLERIE